jgi:hypothetical protein
VGWSQGLLSTNIDAPGQNYFSLLLLLVSVMVHAENAKVARPCISIKSQLTEVSAGERPVSSELAREDFATIETAQKRLQRTYEKRGLSDCDSTEVTVMAWKEIRATRPRGRLDEDTLFKFANDGFGGLKILSDPRS